jgi:acetyl-CoA acetyltransferase family protein
MALLKDIVFLSGKRTPFGTYLGALKDVDAISLGVQASKAALTQANVRPDEVSHVIFGNVMQTQPDAIYCARHVGLKCEIPEETGAVTVNRLCGSGFESIIQAAHRLQLGEDSIILAGGTENMSQTPHSVRGARAVLRLFEGADAGAPLPAKLNDYLGECLFDTMAGIPMALTAENLAVRYGISREDADEYGYRSQSAWADAQEAGRYAEEIIPVTVGDHIVDVDEHPQLSPLQPEKRRSRFSRERMAELRAIFKKDGTVTAANASGINDGAAAMVLTTMEIALARGQAPLGRLVGYGVAGVDPKHMGIGPAPAMLNALRHAGLTMEDMDLIEVNEAFASQYLAVERELKLNREITNVNSGGIAIGHPLAASGARITTHLLYELRRRGARYGVGSACIGGGQGIAVVVEAL